MTTILTDLTYSELSTLIGSSGLKDGLQYKITDFATKHYYFTPYAQVDVINTGATEALIVTATSSNTLAVNAWSPSHPEDIIEYDWNPANWEDDIAFWKDGAIITGWKGAIIRRVDTIRKLDAPCDIRNWKSIRYEADIPEHDLTTNFTGFVHVYEASTNDVYRSLVPTGNQNHALSDEDWWCKVVIWDTDNVIPIGWSVDTMPICHDSNGIGYGASGGIITILPATSNVQYLPIFDSDCQNITINGSTKGENYLQTQTKMPNGVFINSKNITISNYINGGTFINCSDTIVMIHFKSVIDATLIFAKDCEIELLLGALLGSNFQNNYLIGIFVGTIGDSCKNNFHCNITVSFIGHDFIYNQGFISGYFGNNIEKNQFILPVDTLLGEALSIPNDFKKNIVKVAGSISGVTSTKATADYTTTIEEDVDGDIVIWNIDSAGAVDSEDL